MLFISLVALFVTGRFVLASYEKDVRLAEDEKAEARQKAKLSKQKEFGKRAKGLSDWGLPVPWLDEMFDLTSRIPDVNVLRITSVAIAPTTRDVKVAQTHTAKMTVQGIFLDMDRGPARLEELLEQFRSGQDVKYYLVDKKVVEDSKFQFTVLIKRRPPSENTRGPVERRPMDSACGVAAGFSLRRPQAEEEYLSGPPILFVTAK